jgi:hypothetical protein
MYLHLGFYKMFGLCAGAMRSFAFGVRFDVAITDGSKFCLSCCLCVGF